MSGRVCYLARAGATGGPSLLRLVGPGSDEVWESPDEPGEPAAVLARTAEAADWTAQRAAQGDGPRNEIALVCVDVDGATCAWLTSPSSDEHVIAAVMAQGGGDWAGSGTDVGAAGGAWAPASPADASVQALAAPPESQGKPRLTIGRPGAKKGVKAAVSTKLAIAAVPDVDARLFIDALDERGVSVDRAVSLWHALALAWDPAGPGAAGSLRAEGVVAASAPATAVILIDPSGRLVWAWSRAGELLTGGTIRLVRERREGASPVVLAAPEVGRLAADWLSWSVQLGVVPARILCVGPRTAGEVGGEGLSPAALGAALTRALPGATVDLAVHDDPVGATLRRLAGIEAPPVSQDGRLALVALTRRPGRAHRSMYRWAAACILGLALALAAVGWQANAAASRLRTLDDGVRQKMIDDVSAVAKPQLGSPQEAKLRSAPALYMTEALATKQAALNPASGLEPAAPILAELETLSYPLGTHEIQIDDLSLMNTGVMISVTVPDTPTGEALRSALDSIGSNCNWNLTWGTGAAREGKRSVTFYGKWKDQKP